MTEKGTAHEKDILRTFSLAQEGEFKKAIALIETILKDPKLDRTADNVLRMINNYLICCIHAQEYEKGSAFADSVQDLAPSNYHIFHNAACLYCYTGQLEKAVEQVKLARKYGGMALIKLLEKDEDLRPIFDHPGFIEAITPKKRLAKPVLVKIPDKGPAHHLFKGLPENEGISMFFTYKSDFDEGEFKKAEKAITSWYKGTDWKSMGTYDEKVRLSPIPYKNGFEVHFMGVRSPRKAMEDAIRRFKTIKPDLVELLILRRALDKGCDALGPVVEDPTAPEFKVTESEEEFWSLTFDVKKPIPYPEDAKGMLTVFPMNDGSMVTELRGPITYMPGLRISYGLVNVKELACDDASKRAGQLLQKKLAKYFYREMPDVFNKEGELDGPLDRIEKDGRKGFAFALKRDQLVEPYSKRFRYKEYELFSALGEVIKELGLAPVIHWSRDYAYIVNIWENDGKARRSRKAR
jgi:tetratricopeptide (TPR) repeat protein